MGNSEEQKNIGVLVSGRGSNLQAIIDWCANERIPAKISVVVSDQEQAYALTRAAHAGIPAYTVKLSDFNRLKEAYEQRIAQILSEHKVQLVCLAGYMRIVGDVLLKAYENRIINIHPTLLPSFPGLHGQEQAWRYGVKYSGCTVHFVDSGLDTGPIILQAVVPVQDEDTSDTLAERILEQEHLIYPEAIKLYCENKLVIEGRKVKIKK